MPDTMIRIVTTLLAGMFVWAAVAKIVRWSAWRRALAGYRLSSSVELVAAAGTPLAEVGVGAALLSPAPRIGAAFAVALLAGFSLVVLRGRTLQGDKLPCGCFGGARERDYRTMLARNGLLGVLAGIVLVSQRDATPLEQLSLPGAGEWLPALLIALGVIVVAWMVYQLGTVARRGWRS